MGQENFMTPRAKICNIGGIVKSKTLKRSKSFSSISKTASLERTLKNTQIRKQNKLKRKYDFCFSSRNSVSWQLKLPMKQKFLLTFLKELSK